MRSNAHDNAEQVDDEPRSMPLSFEDSAEALTLAPGATRRKFGFGTMMLLGVVAVGALGLFSMRYFARHGSAAETQSDAGKLVESFLKERGASDAQTALPADLLGMDGSTQLRIERDELSKDPFFFEGASPSVAPSAAGSGAKSDLGTPSSQADLSPEDRRAAQREGWNAIIDMAVLELRVQSTLVASRSSASVATVNDKVMRIGDTVETSKTSVRFSLIEVLVGSARFRVRNDELGVDRIVTVAAQQKM